MPGVLRFLIYYVFLVRMMVDTEIMLMYYLSLQLKENGKTWTVPIEQIPDLVYNIMDIIRAQKMEFWLGPLVYTQWWLPRSVQYQWEYPGKHSCWELPVTSAM